MSGKVWFLHFSFIMFTWYSPVKRLYVINCYKQNVALGPSWTFYRDYKGMFKLLGIEGLFICSSKGIGCIYIKTLKIDLTLPRIACLFKREPL